MSRDEFADGINDAMSGLYPDRNLGSFYVTGKWVGSMERGERRWTSDERRAALRQLTGVKTDYELGLHEQRERPSLIDLSGDPPQFSEALPAVAEQGGSASADDFVDSVAPNSLVKLPAPNSGTAAPALVLEDLDRLEAISSAGYHLDSAHLVSFVTERLADCAIDDGHHGPRYALPGVLGILSIVHSKIRTVEWSVRRPLLQAGAQAAEFAGWLYRDLGHAGTAEYWRDRATEWAMETSDFAMAGYILIKKSQAAWDTRDAARMLGLAESVQDGPWTLPPRAMAEAIQQQARGLAMMRASRRKVDDSLRRARGALDQAVSASTPFGAHYDGELFKLQTAICYGESGRPGEAVEMYDSTLKAEFFSARDFAYFSALRAQAHAAVQHPDQAATIGMAAFPTAASAGSARTLQELTRLQKTLHPWRDRPAVRSLARLMSSV